MEKISIYYSDSYDDKSSRSLLKIAASQHIGTHPSDIIIGGERGQKPYFKNYTAIHFSVSHSGKIWAAAFANDEVGFDVQDLSHSRDCLKIAERFFSDNEINAVRSSCDIIKAFTEIWSRKEAVVKLFGIGIDSKFKGFDSTKDVIEFFGEKVFIKDISCFENMASAIAYKSDFEIEFIKL